MTSKIVVNNIEADAGVSTVTFNSNVERGTSNLHSVGLEAAGINVLGADTPIGSGSTIYDDGGARFSGIVTATSFSGSLPSANLTGALPALDGSNLTGISAGVSLANGADNRVVTATGAAALNAESGLTYTGSRLTQSSGDTIIDQTNNGYGGLRIVDSSAGNYSVSYILGRNSGLSAHVFKYAGRTQNQSPWNNNGTGNEMGRWSAAGLSFNGDTAAANCLNDYEEGTWTPGASGFTIGSTQSATYTKIGRLVFVQCYLNTASGSSGSTLIVTGLPFVVATGNNYQYGTGRLGGASYNNSQHMITFEFTTGNSYFIPKVSDGNINWGMLSGTHLMMSGCYQTN